MACSGTSDHGTHRGPAKSQGAWGRTICLNTSGTQLLYAGRPAESSFIPKKKEKEQTNSVYQSSHSTLPTLLGNKVDEHSCTYGAEYQTKSPHTTENGPLNSVSQHNDQKWTDDITVQCTTASACHNYTISPNNTIIINIPLNKTCDCLYF